MAEPTQHRLDELGEQIDEARRQAEKDGLVEETTSEPTLEDPNPHDEDDDNLASGAQPPG